MTPAATDEERAAADAAELARLGRLYDDLREKLLDLSRRNRMLNYPVMAARSKRQLQIVDEVLAEVYGRLVGEEKPLRVVPLPEPENIPPDEQTPEFTEALDHARATDLDYLTGLAGLEEAGRDDEHEVAKLDRGLRDRVRAALELPPLPSRGELNRAEEARRHGIEPNPELPPAAAGEKHRDNRLQTLRFPDELEATMATIAAEARLAEQEAGLSTLFLSFGFLEWYETDAADKPSFAPLILLPVQAEKTRVRGREMFDIVAREGGAETNVSLRRFLEKRYRLDLPELADDGEENPVEAYLDAVRDAVSGMKRWRVRRWLILGHFAFSRIAIYEDTDPARWPEPPAAHPLVGALLAGHEQDGAGPALAPPEDYPIDDPAVAKIAPWLIHDADASQHSALIDVMKAKNLVIEGPPGTGKSQTITNVVANALAGGKTVLFLAEKQAALDVVKRRLDQAGLGDFCLELHSEKATPKAVVESLKARAALGIAPPRAAPPPDPAWSLARTEIADYLAALHAPAADGATPFGLIWQTIRSRRTLADAQALIRSAPLPPELATEPEKIPELRSRLELFALGATGFAAAHGHAAALSPWRVTPPGDVPAYEREAVLAALAASRDALAALQATSDAEAAAGLTPDEALALAPVDAALGTPPPDESLAALAGLDPDALERDFAPHAARLDAAAALAALPPPTVAPAIVARARALAAGLPEGVTAYAAADIYSQIDTAIRSVGAHLDAVAALRPVLQPLGLPADPPARSLAAVATAIIAVAPIIERHWPIAQAGGAIDRAAFTRLHADWQALRRDDAAFRAAIPSIGRSPWPAAAELDRAVGALGRSGLRALFGGNAGRETAARLGLADAPDGAATLARLTRHAHALEAFAADAEGRLLLGARWAGLATPLDDIAEALRQRWDAEAKVAPLPAGPAVLTALFALPLEHHAAVATYRDIARAYLDSAALGGGDTDAGLLSAALVRREEQVTALRKLVAADPERALAADPLPLRTLAAIADARDRLTAAEAAAAVTTSDDALRRLAPDAAGLARLDAALAWLKAVRATPLPPALADRLVSGDAALWRGRLRDAVAARASLVAAEAAAAGPVQRYGFAFDAVPAGDLVPHLGALLAHGAELVDFAALRAARAALAADSLGPFLVAADAANLAPERLLPVFDGAVARLRVEAARRSAEPLARRTGSDLDARRFVFAERDRKRKGADREAIKATLLARRPQPGIGTGPVRNWTEMSLLTREFQKQARYTRVRGLLDRARHSVRALKPCFMMSPLSLAKFLPAGGFQFDVLVIDEASQMKPEDALGAMLRAKQIVVVGDSRQLPPTTFFERSGDAAPDDDGDEDLIDDESILERCQKVFREIRSLKWHYRSRCESLIRFSNDQFYKTLITFPAARPGSFSVSLLRVDGAYQARRNVAEAERIVEEAVAFMRRFADLDAAAVPTLGIVALNTDQRDLIQELLWRATTGDEAAARYADKVEGRGEDVFVKNLENVQGDERDHIFISMTYGRAPGATVLAQRFGPINGRHGHRRLNVLFTRARMGVVLFASFGSADVRPGEGSSRGVEVLKAYLAYAETRGRAPVERIGGEAESDFESAVAERLRARGYECDAQVGVSGFRIDLGVRNPDRPDTYLAGLECDGATYHSSKSARDRDRLREEVLKGLGWDLLRVWSTDWYDDPDAQTERLLRRLDELRRKAPPPDVTWRPAVFDRTPPVEPGPDPGDLVEAGVVLAEGELLALPAPQAVAAAPGLTAPPQAATGEAIEVTVIEAEWEPLDPPRAIAAPAGNAPPAAPPPAMDETATPPEAAPAADATPEPAPSPPAPEPVIAAEPAPPAAAPPPHPGAALLAGDGPLTIAEAFDALAAYRETIIRPASPSFQPHRSILRDAMIETFITQRVVDRDEWFTRIPHFLRAATDPAEKRDHLAAICAIVDRIGDGKALPSDRQREGAALQPA